MGILLSELSRRRIRSINKLIRVGRTEPVVVIRVDKDKGYIDLSKRRVSKEDIERCTEKYSKAKAVNIRADFECSCFTYEGIDAVKEALRAGIAAGNPEIPIRINLIAPPVYVMTCSTPDKADGLAVLTDGCKAVEEKIVGSGGNFVMQMAPKVVTATDEDELAARIRKAEEENAEVDGDEDDEDQVGMGGNKDVGSGSEDDEDDKKKGSGDEDGSDEE